MAIMLSMLAVFYVAVIFILYRTRRSSKVTFEEYSVGGRSYGP